ncbi:MAG: IS1634 family transposase [Vicingaceae bacterium]|nr:IS1634 family transposase [Vicingaceae bacterium]
MSYIVKQKIKGKIYLYEVTSLWDKEKKKPIQKRKYLGPENKIYTKSKNADYSKVISKNHGNITLLQDLGIKSGVTEVLRKYFPLDFENILALAYYEISEASASYLYHYWLEEQNLPNIPKLHSSQISDFYAKLGLDQKTRLEFNKVWIEHLKPIHGVYYDITSVSSYATEIDFVEWGYNRDKENLAQINIGMVCCQKTTLPFYYNIFSGSIVDVSTIKNLLEYLKYFEIKQIKHMMDRGFCSTSNILALNNLGENFTFSQPLSFSLKKAKDLVTANKKALKSNKTAFLYKEEIVHFVKSKITFDSEEFDAHIFFNEKAELEQRHAFLAKLMEIESKYNQIKLETNQEFENHVNGNISEKTRKYFKWNKKTKKLEKDLKNIEIHLNNQGYFIVIGNENNLDKHEILDNYRNKDMIEKIFDVMKNETDGNRLRVHSDMAVQGKLFVKFIALILYMQMSKTMKEKKMFDKFSVKEVLLELRKIKKIFIDENITVVSEITKKQKQILDAFGLDVNTHGY